MQGEGVELRVSANEYSCAHHVTWSPNKPWRSTSIFNLWFYLPIVYIYSVATYRWRVPAPRRGEVRHPAAGLLRDRCVQLDVQPGLHPPHYQGGAPPLSKHVKLSRILRALVSVGAPWLGSWLADKNLFFKEWESFTLLFSRFFLGWLKINLFRQFSWNCESKLQRTNTENWKQICPEKNCAGTVPVSTSMCLIMSDLYYIPTIDLAVLLQEICGPILGIYNSLTFTWMRKLGLKPRYSQKRNTYWGFSLQCGGES